MVFTSNVVTQLLESVQEGFLAYQRKYEISTDSVKWVDADKIEVSSGRIMGNKGGNPVIAVDIKIGLRPDPVPASNVFHVADTLRLSETPTTIEFSFPMVVQLNGQG